MISVFLKSIALISTQNIFGETADSKKYNPLLWSKTVLHLVEEIFGSSSVFNPKGTETFLITLKTLAKVCCLFAFLGIAFI